MEGALVAVVIGACCGLPLLLAGSAALLGKITGREPESRTPDEQVRPGVDGDYGVAEDSEQREYDRQHGPQA